MKSYLPKISLGAIALAGMMALPTSAFAITSCWQASDPPGCWLQCTFGGPCPLESISGEAVAEIEFKLPSAKTEMSQKVSERLKKMAKMDKDSLMRSRKMFAGSTLVQTCEPEKLLGVIGETASPMKVADACFTKK
jgi:hypothetical protein